MVGTPIFRDTLGKGLNTALNGLGFKNPNKYITKYQNDLNSLRYSYNQLSTLNKELKELESVSKNSGLDNSGLIKEIKKDIGEIIEKEKLKIIKSNSKILSELEAKNAFGKK